MEGNIVDELGDVQPRTVKKHYAFCKLGLRSQQNKGIGGNFSIDRWFRLSYSRIVGGFYVA